MRLRAFCLLAFSLLAFSLFGIATCCRADDDPLKATTAAAQTAPAATASTTTSMMIAEPAWSPRPQRARPTAPATAAATTSPDKATSDHPADFTSEETWDVAGYNNDEIIYTIFITNRDSRIIRCTTDVKGFYYENGEKHDVSDRQSTTVFPQQRTQAGNWQGMDKSSGATYSVKCRPI